MYSSRISCTVFLKVKVLYKKFKCGRPSKESFLKVATTRAELHKIQHKSIQAVAEVIGLAGVSLPPFSRPPRVSLAVKTLFPKTPSPFPFKRLPRRLRSNGTGSCLA